MKRIIIACLFTLLFSSLITHAQNSDSIEVDGLVRTYLLHIPANYDAEKAHPLVIVLHGGNGEGERIMNLSNFNALADEAGFIVVYPDGVEENWNDGRGLEDRYAQVENIDDVNFIRELIDHISDSYTIDSQRIYATGISNGGHMAFRLACDLSDKVAAVAPVVANLSLPLRDMCDPEYPVSVMMMSGTGDPMMPFEGGDGYAVNLFLGTVLSANESAQFWAEKNNCEAEVESSQLPDIDPRDGTTILLDIYSGCAEDTHVYLYSIENGGHTWAGGAQYLPRFIIGRVSKDIDATETIWSFFSVQTLEG